ncbi:hypothetical protein KSP40_PGU003974 [Platanthera guangdongensis]|uniref:Uncharacterized protein n=1 Tax=Platanthera guangdongensis TaxID=2320717 RepID=A0ABR2LTS9_9ASPA
MARWTDPRPRIIKTSIWLPALKALFPMRPVLSSLLPRISDILDPCFVFLVFLDFCAEISHIFVKKNTFWGVCFCAEK